MFIISNLESKCTTCYQLWRSALEEGFISLSIGVYVTAFHLSML